MVLYDKWCSPLFYEEVMGGAFPSHRGRVPVIQYINPVFKFYFEYLEDKYADRLWNAMKRRGQTRTLHFNFDRDDFSRTGIGPPKHVCGMFLNELCRDDKDTKCKRSCGKFMGIWFDVWNNGSFTTHFTW
jgi:hypothetical protein